MFKQDRLCLITHLASLLVSQWGEAVLVSQHLLTTFRVCVQADAGERGLECVGGRNQGWMTTRVSTESLVRLDFGL